jgi:hypothetical protein
MELPTWELYLLYLGSELKQFRAYNRSIRCVCDKFVVGIILQIIVVVAGFYFLELEKEYITLH